jgi:hypothetical protein
MVDVRSVDEHAVKLPLAQVPSKSGVNLGNQTFVAHLLKDPRTLISLSDVDKVNKKANLGFLPNLCCTSALLSKSTGVQQDLSRSDIVFLVNEAFLSLLQILFSSNILIFGW